MNQFQAIEPVRLAQGQTSPVIPLSLIPGEGFVRIIAIFKDGEPLGGEAPTFQIAAGTGGLFTSVEAGAGAVDIPAPNGPRAAIATCTREPGNADIFLITLTAIRDNAVPSRLRIRNNDPETLTFLGFCSDKARDTLQPWMKIGNAPEFQLVSFVGAESKTIEVRNFGTTTLIFQDQPGPIGDSDAKLALRAHPGTLAPHGLGVLKFETLENPLRSMTAEFSIQTNDKISDHAMMQLAVKHVIVSSGPPHPPTDAGSFCRTGCGCQHFQGSPTASTCENCGHTRSKHQPI